MRKALAVASIFVACHGSERDRADTPRPVVVETPPAAPLVDASRELAVAIDAGEAHAEPDASTAAPFPPPGVRRVLHVGDSTVGYGHGLALELRRLFTKAGVRYEAYSETAAGLHDFAVSRKLEELVREKNPDVVIVTLGVNNLTVPHPDAYENDVRSIVRQAGRRSCYWVGPLSLPRVDAGDGLVVMLNGMTSPCRFFDSYHLEIERQPDGVHPTQRGAHLWADGLWDFMKASPPSTP